MLASSSACAGSAAPIPATDSAATIVDFSFIQSTSLDVQFIAKDLRRDQSISAWAGDQNTRARRPSQTKRAAKAALFYLQSSARRLDVERESAADDDFHFILKIVSWPEGIRRLNVSTNQRQPHEETTF